MIRSIAGYTSNIGWSPGALLYQVSNACASSGLLHGSTFVTKPKTGLTWLTQFNGLKESNS